MSTVHPRLAPRSWLRLPRRTARFRLTALYGSLFLVSGAALLAATYGLFERATKFKSPRLPKIPGAPSLNSLLPVPSGATVNYGPHKGVLGLAQQELSRAQYQLGQIKLPNRVVFNIGPTRQLLSTAQNQLTSAEHQLVRDVHEITHSGYLQAAQRATDSHQLLINSGIALVLVALLALLSGWLLAGRMLRPIRTITRKARRISSTNLHERLALDGPRDELKELGDTLDELFERLNVSFEAQRQFVASASHELRTPMTVERALLQVALDNPDLTVAEWRSTALEVLASNEEQGRLIDGLLTLASSDRGLNESHTVDLAVVVGAQIDELQPEFDRLGIRVEVATASAPMDGDPLLIERLVANLLNNATRHNVADGRIRVATEVTADHAVLSVTNTGVMISPDEVERLFQPFQRLDPRRAIYQDGHGLGLSIVRSIAMMHGANIEAHPEPGGGLFVSVAFSSDPGRVTDPSVPDKRRGTDVEFAAP
jgi:signal transduction histidine kinase